MAKNKTFVPGDMEHLLTYTDAINFYQTRMMYAPKNEADHNIDSSFPSKVKEVLDDYGYDVPSSPSDRINMFSRVIVDSLDKIAHDRFGYLSSSRDKPNFSIESLACVSDDMAVQLIIANESDMLPYAVHLLDKNNTSPNFLSADTVAIAESLSYRNLEYGGFPDNPLPVFNLNNYSKHLESAIIPNKWLSDDMLQVSANNGINNFIRSRDTFKLLTTDEVSDFKKQFDDIAYSFTSDYEAFAKASNIPTSFCSDISRSDIVDIYLHTDRSNSLDDDSIMVLSSVNAPIQLNMARDLVMSIDNISISDKEDKYNALPSNSYSISDVIDMPNDLRTFCSTIYSDTEWLDHVVTGEDVMDRKSQLYHSDEQLNARGFSDVSRIEIVSDEDLLIKDIEAFKESLNNISRNELMSLQDALASLENTEKRGVSYEY